MTDALNMLSQISKYKWTRNDSPLASRLDIAQKHVIYLRFVIETCRKLIVYII